MLKSEFKSEISEEEEIAEEYEESQDNSVQENNNKSTSDNFSRMSIPKTLYFSVADILNAESIEQRENFFNSNVIDEGID